MKSTPINNVRNNTEQSKKALDFIVKHHIEFLKFQKKQAKS